jgi:hypothetical protein
MWFRMRTRLTVLQCGECEPLKAGVHAAALGLFAVMGLYNTAAWLLRRERHLGVNAVLYSVLTLWEQHHVTHHVARMRAAPVVPLPLSAPDSSSLAA